MDEGLHEMRMRVKNVFEEERINNEMKTELHVNRTKQYVKCTREFL